jgi:TRAP-type C4-dicarboxylate transport system permease small subunit
LPALRVKSQSELIGLYVLAAVAFFLGFMVVHGALLAQLTFADCTPTLGLPVAPSYLALPAPATRSAGR